jgi:protein BCP1
MAKGQMDEEDEDWQSEGEMNIDFLFLDPNENQFSSVKLLVNGYLDGLSFRSSELAELIVK